MSTKVPNMPDGSPADYVVRFIKCTATFDIDGKQYTLAVIGIEAVVTDDFADKVIYRGPAPCGPFALECAEIIVGIL
jgi:hypothetical protein